MPGISGGLSATALAPLGLAALVEHGDVRPLLFAWPFGLPGRVVGIRTGMLVDPAALPGLQPIRHAQEGHDDHGYNDQGTWLKVHDREVPVARSQQSRGPRHWPKPGPRRWKGVVSGASPSRPNPGLFDLKGPDHRRRLHRDGPEGAFRQG